MDLTRKNWEAGWIPSDDEFGGRRNGLLRMDNCYLDNKGIVSLVPGLSRANSIPLPGLVHTIYSKYFNATKHRFVGIGNGSVYVSTGGGFGELIGGGNPGHACFATAFGQVLISSGTERRKYDGNVAYELGLEKANIPQVEAQLGPVVSTTEYNPGDTTLVTGDNLDIEGINEVIFDTGAEYGLLTAKHKIDALSLDPGYGGDPGLGKDTDWFNWPLRIGDIQNLKKVRLYFMLDTDLEGGNDYYVKEWSNEIQPSDFNQGWTTLSCQRKDFERHGGRTSNSSTTGRTKDWRDVEGIRIEIICSAVLEGCVSTYMAFYGSDKGPLTGSYEYLQVNIFNNGIYRAQSGASDKSVVVTPQYGKTKVTLGPVIDEEVNEVDIYRRSAETGIDVTAIGEAKKLDRFYRIYSGPVVASFDDLVSDDDALLEGTILDERITSIHEMTDEIIGISDTVHNRVLYITYKDVVISSFNDLDSYNPLHVIKLSANTAERNLWIKKIGNDTVLIGTTKDIYQITGTWEELPDSTLNIVSIGLGVEYAPISVDCCVEGGYVYYLTAQGWMRTAGQGAELILGDLDLLYRGQNRYGIAPVVLYPNAQARYGCAFYKGQFWTFMNLADGTRQGFIYDFNKQYWHLRKLECITLFVEEDGTLLGGFGGGSGNYLNILDNDPVSGDDLAGVNGQDLYVLTIFDDNEQPRNRKDTFTFKFYGDTGGGTINLALAKENKTFIPIGTFSSNGYGEQLYEVYSSTINLGKRFALRITGTDLNEFKFYGFTLEYDARPEQVNALRIPSTNQGTLVRKRWTSYAFVIDTLGADITFTPLVDNIAQDTSTVNTSEKLTHRHFFTAETTGVDISGLLTSTPDNPFEFYQVNLEETVSEKLPSPAKYLIIPQDDYGNPNRKRHSSYKFKINTRGASVRFTPKLDGVTYTPLDFSTSEKRTVEYFFAVDTIAIDIGGILESLADTDFEFYGVVVPQDIEVLPPRLKEKRIPENNYGIAARKRVRTMPMEINTNGSDVTFTPIVDGVAGTPTTLNTNTRATAFHYFITDVFGVDFSGDLIGTDPFEFYGLLKPEEVEVLPVAKKFDQIGPVDYLRIAKFHAFRVRLIALGYTIPYTIYIEDTAVYSDVIATIPNIDKVYEIMRFPKTMAGTVFRIELGPADQPFHRYYGELKMGISGSETANKWQKIK